MIEEFERHLRGTNLSENTISSYLFAIRQYSSQYDGITKKNLRAYKVWLIENYKPKTVNLRLRAINCYLESIGKESWKMPFVRVQQKAFLENVISEADYEYFKTCLKRDDEMFWYFVIRFLVATGARVSELIQIKVEHIKLGHGDELCTLKSAGIMHYIVRSGKYTIERSIKVSWENREKLERPSDFLIATLELANVRNALIHGGRVEKWPEDPIPVITRNAEILVEACKFVAEENVDSQVTPTANLDLVLAENHIKPGNRVKHVLLGEGTIVDVLPKTFSVDFDNSTRKAFLLSSAQKFFTAI